jgi:hypothetical protein
MKIKKLSVAIAAIVLVGALVATMHASGASTGVGAGYAAGNEPTFDPSNFGSPADNPLFPLPPGRLSVFKGMKDGQRVTTRTKVTGHTKEILGIAATVVHDVSTHGGRPLEATFDWYAPDNDGTVWYLGEDTKEFDERGHVISTEGSWQAGVDGAVPGVIMLTNPQVDDAYRQEFYAGHAEDQAWTVRLGGALTVPYGTVHHIMRSLEWTRLEPRVVTLKVYSPGVGIVLERDLSGGHETFQLISVRG